MCCRSNRGANCRSTFSAPRPPPPAPGRTISCCAPRAISPSASRGLTLGAFRLAKFLPVAAGIGGGSSDAAAALRLLARANGLSHDDPRVMAAARATGADTPVCVSPRARMMRGVGEILGEPLRLPPLPAVLINPGVPVETRAVFQRLGFAPGATLERAAHPPITPDMSADALWSALRKGRNDLEDAACVLAPVIVDALAVLGASKGCRLARMSGSGATCFGLFVSRVAASRASAVIKAQQPGWWVRSAMLR